MLHFTHICPLTHQTRKICTTQEILDLQHLLALQTDAYDEQNAIWLRTRLDEKYPDRVKRMHDSNAAHKQLRNDINETKIKIATAIETMHIEKPTFNTDAVNVPVVIPVVPTSTNVKHRSSSKLDVPFTIKEVRRIHVLLSEPEVKDQFNGCLNIVWKCAWVTECQQKRFNYVRFGFRLGNAKDAVDGVGSAQYWEGLFEELVANNDWTGIIDHLTAVYAVFNLTEPTLDYLTEVNVLCEY